MFNENRKKRVVDAFRELCAHPKIIPTQYVYCEDYVQDCLRELILKRRVRKEKPYDFDTLQTIRSRLFDFAHDCGLILKCEV